MNRTTQTLSCSQKCEIKHHISRRRSHFSVWSNLIPKEPNVRIRKPGLHSYRINHNHQRCYHQRVRLTCAWTSQTAMARLRLTHRLPVCRRCKQQRFAIQRRSTINTTHIRGYRMIKVVIKVKQVQDQHEQFGSDCPVPTNPRTRLHVKWTTFAVFIGYVYMSATYVQPQYA